MPPPIDALLLVSFGGPESPNEVLPFLENVTRGRGIPRERLLEVAKHYDQFDGISPLNGQNRQLIAALHALLKREGPELPIYWGNRNWHPLLTDTVAQMARDGIRRSAAFVTSAFSSYSGCRQYLEDIERAREQTGPDAPEIEKLRVFYNHPGFIEAMTERTRAAIATIPSQRRDSIQLLFTAHSIPLAMADNCDYVLQLQESCRLICEQLKIRQWQLVYQSRSGPPQVPWLEPDVCDVIGRFSGSAVADVVLVPLGFLSDHMEVVFDLDYEARAVCQQLDINMARAQTVGTHPRYVAMIRELLFEKMDPTLDRPAIGSFSASHNACPAGCCRYSPRKGRPVH